LAQEAQVVELTLHLPTTEVEMVLILGLIHLHHSSQWVAVAVRATHMALTFLSLMAALEAVVVVARNMVLAAPVDHQLKHFLLMQQLNTDLLEVTLQQVQVMLPVQVVEVPALSAVQ
jgi:hypothetical protein